MVVVVPGSKPFWTPKSRNFSTPSQMTSKLFRPSIPISITIVAILDRENIGVGGGVLGDMEGLTDALGALLGTPVGCVDAAFVGGAVAPVIDGDCDGGSDGVSDGFVEGRELGWGNEGA